MPFFPYGSARSWTPVPGVAPRTSFAKFFAIEPYISDDYVQQDGNQSTVLRLGVSYIWFSACRRGRIRGGKPERSKPGSKSKALTSLN